MEDLVARTILVGEEIEIVAVDGNFGHFIREVSDFAPCGISLRECIYPSDVERAVGLGNRRSDNPQNILGARLCTYRRKQARINSNGWHYTISEHCWIFRGVSAKDVQIRAI